MPRPSWEGFLRLNLLSVPVKGYTALVSGGGHVSFHQIHAECGNRIRYKKVCPVHGEVSNEEIVSGYEVAKGQHVVVDSEELNELRTGADKAINIEVFIAADKLDPVYFTDRSYYLVPDGKVGEKPYAVLHKVMSEDKRFAVAKMILTGREHMVLVRPVEHLLIATVLNFAENVKVPAAFADEVHDVKIAPAELKLAHTLINATTAKSFDFASYKNEYASNVKELIERKASGQRITVPQAERPVVVNLMDALRKSLKKSGDHRTARKHAAIKLHKPTRLRKIG